MRKLYLLLIKMISEGAKFDLLEKTLPEICIPVNRLDTIQVNVHYAHKLTFDLRGDLLFTAAVMRSQVFSLPSLVTLKHQYYMKLLNLYCHGMERKLFLVIYTKIIYIPCLY